MPIYYASTGGSAGYPEVPTFAELPVATGSGAISLVSASSGVWLISRKSAGFYKDTAAGVWTYVGDYPVNCSSIAVDTTLLIDKTLSTAQVLAEHVDALQLLTTENLAVYTPAAGVLGDYALTLASGRSFKIDCSTNSPTSFNLKFTGVPVGTKLVAVTVLIKFHATNALPTITQPSAVAAQTYAINKTFVATYMTEDNGTTWRIFAAGSY